MPDIYRLGLLGNSLGHSLSPLIHHAALRALDLRGDYRLFEVRDEKELEKFLCQLREDELQGLNVTIPYKRSVVKLVDVLTPTARSIGAINTLFSKNQQVIGENTDANGFLGDIRRLNWFPGDMDGQHALVLGAGGAASAIVFALFQEGWHVTIAARRLAQAEQLASSLLQSPQNGSTIINPKCIHLDSEDLSTMQYKPDLIVNTTPVGMHPEEEKFPWPAGLAFPVGAAVYDLIYNPADTQLTKAARAAGLRAASGVGMLVEQAALSFEIWTGLPAPRAEMFASLAAYGASAR